VLTELIWIAVALLGGTAAVDRAAGWSFMFSQPIVGACLAGALARPGPEWELWALRVPIGVGALLQLLLTDASLPAAQRPHDTATAGVVGTTTALFCMERLHDTFPANGAGMLWVLIGVAAGLLSAIAGGWVVRLHRSFSRTDVVRAERLAAAGDGTGFEWLYWGGVGRAFLLGGVWTVTASLLLTTVAIVALPRMVVFLSARRIGFLFAAVLGAALAAGFHAHVRGRRQGFRWAALGAISAVVLLTVLRSPAP
jgi:hypothetical protein